MNRDRFSTVREDFCELCDRLFDSIAHDLLGDADRIATSDVADCLHGQLSSFNQWNRLGWEDQSLLLDEWIESKGEHLYA